MYPKICRRCHKGFQARFKRNVLCSRACAALERRNGRTFKCRVCRTPYYRNKAQIAARQTTYCSQACHTIGKTVRVQRICARCGKHYESSPTRRIYFCKRSCWQPPGATRKDEFGYVWSVNYREHRRVMEKHLGRELKRNELIHHIDGNKGNNAIGNLWLCSGKQHVAAHRSGQELMYSLFKKGVVEFKDGNYVLAKEWRSVL